MTITREDRLQVWQFYGMGIVERNSFGHDMRARERESRYEAYVDRGEDRTSARSSGFMPIGHHDLAERFAKVRAEGFATAKRSENDASATPWIDRCQRLTAALAKIARYEDTGEQFYGETPKDIAFAALTRL